MTGREPWSEAMSLRERVETAVEVVDQRPVMRGTLDPRHVNVTLSYALALGHRPRVDLEQAFVENFIGQLAIGRRRLIDGYWIVPTHPWDERLPEVVDWHTRIRGA